MHAVPVNHSIREVTSNELAILCVCPTMLEVLSMIMMMIMIKIVQVIHCNQRVEVTHTYLDI